MDKLRRTTTDPEPGTRVAVAFTTTMYQGKAKEKEEEEEETVKGKGKAKMADEEVELDDKCNVIQFKIHEFLLQGGTQARLCREISKTNRDGKSVSSKPLSSFLAKT